MSRLIPNSSTRTATLETCKRQIDLPVDGAGHFRRLNKHTSAQVRAANGSDPHFQGKFIPFGQRQWIGSQRWGYWEVNVPGCITKTIQERNGTNNDITLNRDHNNLYLLARTSNGTLRLTADEQYGYADADLGQYSYTADVVTAVERGDLTGMSYAFDMIDYSWDVAEDGHDILYIREMALYDTAIVGMPANVDTDANMRMDLLAVARNAGFDTGSFDTLARRLADPDIELLDLLRSLANAPGETTQEMDGTPPVETTETRTTAHPLALATLAKRTTLMEEILSR